MMKQMIRCVLTEGVVESPSLKKQSPWRTDTLPLMFLVPMFHVFVQNTDWIFSALHVLGRQWYSCAERTVAVLHYLDVAATFFH